MVLSGKNKTPQGNLCSPMPSAKLLFVRHMNSHYHSSWLHAGVLYVCQLVILSWSVLGLAQAYLR